MHGVKRLFGWMIPRFDRTRYDVSLVSLRKRDLSEETLDALGIDIQYLHRSKFDPATLTALLKIDVLHLHGYGATTFGRMAGKMRGLPTILHEHANLTETPWFQKIADRLLAPSTDLAIAVSKSTADFVIRARQMPPGARHSRSRRQSRTQQRSWSPSMVAACVVSTRCIASRMTSPAVGGPVSSTGQAARSGGVLFASTCCLCLRTWFIVPLLRMWGIVSARRNGAGFLRGGPCGALKRREGAERRKAHPTLRRSAAAS